MCNVHLPYNDDKESRRMSLIFAVVFTVPTFVFFYAAFHQTLLFLFFALLCGAISVFCFYGFIVRLKEYLNFRRDVWKEEKVQKIMAENEEILKKAGTAYWLISEEISPRSLSLGLRLAFLLALLPKQRYFVKRGDGLFAYGMLLFLQYAGLSFLGTVLQSDSWRSLEDKWIATLMFVFFFIYWAKSFIQGWRTIHLLRFGKVTGGLVRSHDLTGVFFQYCDTFRNTHWHKIPYSLHKNKKKVTVLFDANKPDKSLILDELVWLKQVRLTENGAIRLARDQLLPSWCSDTLDCLAIMIVPVLDKFSLRG